MPYMTLNRNYLLRTTTGHCIAFEKGQPVWVPPVAAAQAVAIGAEAVSDNDKVDVLGPEVVEEAPLGADDRKKTIFEAFDKLVRINNSKDFTGAGVPSTKAVEKYAQIEADRHEVARLWTEYRVMKAEQQ